MNSISSLLELPLPLVLASQSPRRRALLEQIGLVCRVVPSDVNEEDIHDPTTHPAEYVQHLALHKARNVLEKLEHDALVIGADTTVVLNGVILNKPADEEDAFAMLKQLSNNTHTVYTGVALVCRGAEQTVVQQTQVRFRALGEKEIRAYIATGSPMDKAGAYGIQDDFGAVFVQNIEGCYYNIVGLPLELLYRSLKAFVLHL